MFRPSYLSIPLYSACIIIYNLYYTLYYIIHKWYAFSTPIILYIKVLNTNYYHRWLQIPVRKKKSNQTPYLKASKKRSRLVCQCMHQYSTFTTRAKLVIWWSVHVMCVVHQKRSIFFVEVKKPKILIHRVLTFPRIFQYS